MDVGNSINPAIDIGQVEGGFVQGLGWSCLEELVWGDDQHHWVQRGMLHTRGPGARSLRILSMVVEQGQSVLLCASARVRGVRSPRMLSMAAK
jgi:xanthine dehydrogenase/oxidase